MPKQTTISLFLTSVFLFIATPLFAGEFANTTGNLTLTTNTVVNGAKSIRGGNLTIGAGVTLQVNANATLTFETGRRIINNKGGATILVSRNGGRITKTAAICTNVFCYRDNDGDGYGTGSATIFCNSCPAGYVNRAGDCCDSDRLSYPGYAGYLDGGVCGVSGDFPSGYKTCPNRCGSWDRNCNGVVEKFRDCRTCNNCQPVNFKQNLPGWGDLYEKCNCAAVASVPCGQRWFYCEGKANCTTWGFAWEGCVTLWTCCCPTPPSPTRPYEVSCEHYGWGGAYIGTSCNRTTHSGNEGLCACK